MAKRIISGKLFDGSRIELDTEIDNYYQRTAILPRSYCIDKF